MPIISIYELQTFSALLLAHVLADFIFQNGWIVRNKHQIKIMLSHIGIVFLTTIIVLGGGIKIAITVTVLHLVIDIAKNLLSSKFKQRSALLFCLDQSLHIIVLISVTLWHPETLSTGIWAQWLDTALIPIIFLTGLITTIIPGGYIVSEITKSYNRKQIKQGLPNAGKLIGQLERSVIFLLMYIGQPEAIGFLIAAKSLLRFDASVTKEQEATEYVIIGTLISYGWALAATSITIEAIKYAKILIL